jgi:hypothetical protein
MHLECKTLWVEHDTSTSAATHIVDRLLRTTSRPGEASIDHEFISPQNDRFVLHDSKGFEPGSEDNLQTVRDFIDQRRAKPDLKDQLHAVWWGFRLSAFIRQADDTRLCFEIPRAGGGLLETGVEQFLTSKRKGELGNSMLMECYRSEQVIADACQSSHRCRFH